MPPSSQQNESGTRLQRLFFGLGPFILVILVLLPRISAERAEVANVRVGLEGKIIDLERRVEIADVQLQQASTLDKHTAYVKDLREKALSRPVKEPPRVASFEVHAPSVKFLRSEKWSVVFEWTVEVKNTGNAPGKPEMDLEFLDSDGYLIYELRSIGDIYEPGEQRTERGTIETPDSAAQLIRLLEVTHRVAN